MAGKKRSRSAKIKFDEINKTESVEVDESPQIDDESIIDEVVEKEQEPEPMPEPKFNGFKCIGKWKHLDLFRCNSCAYQTTHKSHMEQHVAQHQKVTQQAEVRVSKIVDSRGLPIRTLVEPPMKKEI